MPEPTVSRERLATRIGDELRDRFTMRPMVELTEASLEAEAARLGYEALGDEFAGIDMARQYQCPAQDCEFLSLDSEEICPVHDRKIYWCGYSLRVNIVPETAEFTIVKDHE